MTVFAAATGWTFEPVPLVVAAGTLLLFWRGFLRLRARSARHAATWRALLFSGAVAGAAAIVVSPVHAAGEGRLVSAHMLEHVVVGDVAPALAVLALRGPLLVFVLPVTLAVAVRRRRRVSRACSLATSAPGALALWTTSLVVWHVPAVYEAAVAHWPLHVAQHASFVAAGILLWVVLLDPARTRRVSTFGRLGVALGAFSVGQLLATTLVLAQSPLYPSYAEDPHRLLGLSPLADLDAAGLLMMGEQALLLGVLALVLVRRHLGEMLDAPVADPLARRPAAPERVSP